MGGTGVPAAAPETLLRRLRELLRVRLGGLHRSLDQRLHRVLEASARPSCCSVEAVDRARRVLASASGESVTSAGTTDSRGTESA